MERSMRTLCLPFVVVALALAACGEAGKTSEPDAAAAAPVGPPTFPNIIANPSAYAGQNVEFKVTLAVGKTMLPSGEIVTATSQAWEDPPGTEHSVSAPADAPESLCVFLVTNDERTPAFPLQAIVTENMSPCLAGSVPPVLAGKVGEANDVKLVVNGQPATVKALTLSDLNFKAPF
jgi:hypothetical protein